ncbi:MAG: recombinase family protein [Planctomycetes bacterium]|nr:recombinase family protein [Planctomycetota bacterium]
MEARRRVAIYVRVSTRVGNGQRLLQQFREVRRMVERRGWTIVRVYRDRASAKQGAHRPEWERLRKDASRRRFDAVAVWAIDRMGRSVLDVLKAAEGFERRGVELLIVKQKVDTTTPLGKLLLTILAAFAQMERELTSERTREGIAARRAKGLPVGRVAILVPRAHIDAVLREEKSAAQVSRETGISVSTIRARVRAAKKEGSPPCKRPLTLDSEKGSNEDH